MCLPTPRPSAATARRSAVIGFGVVIGALVLLPMAVNPLGVLEETRFPSREIVESLDGDRWFHNEATGGYLIYADWPEPLVYIDDRAELYGVSGLTEEAIVIAGAYLEPFETWGITGVIAQPDWPLVDVLLARGGWSGPRTSSSSRWCAGQPTLITATSSRRPGRPTRRPPMTLEPVTRLP